MGVAICCTSIRRLSEVLFNHILIRDILCRGVVEGGDRICIFLKKLEIECQPTFFALVGQCSHRQITTSHMTWNRVRFKSILRTLDNITED